MIDFWESLRLLKSPQTENPQNFKTKPPINNLEEQEGKKYDF